MTKAMCCYVYFLPNDRRGEIGLLKVSSVTIESSWKLICSTAEIELPRNIRDFDKQKVGEVFRRGDAVEIYLGYDGNLELEFKGYIRHVSAEIPIKIKLEDDMFKLKQIPVNFSSANCTLKQFITKTVTTYPTDIDADLALGAVRFSRVTLGEVFNKLQADFSLYPFIRNGKLVIGKPYSTNQNKVYEFILERNCVSSDLNYVSKEDRPVKIVGQSVQNLAQAVRLKQQDKKLKFEWGDTDANDIVHWTFNVTTLFELEREVKKMYEARKRDGFEGRFKTFGVPSLTHGQKVSITSSLYPERSGLYYIDRVVKKFNKSEGYKQEAALGLNAQKATR